MKIAEKMLLYLSKGQTNKDCEALNKEKELENPISLLGRVFPKYICNIAGKEILDFGCGIGLQSAALALKEAKYVFGLDTNLKHLKKANELVTKLELHGQVQFADKLESHFNSKFDIVISQNSMEHFGNPVEVLNIMKSALNQKGVILITFGPPWFAPYGSHMHFFTKMPWVNILFSEETVMRVRAHFRNDGAKRYEEVESGLNKMTVSIFERIISECGLKIEFIKYDCIKDINFLGKVPLIRELFVNRVSCALIKNE